MRIAMLSFRLPGAGAKRGGVERVAHDLAQGLALRAHEVTVWSADPAPCGCAYQVSQLPWSALIHHWLGFRLISGYLGNILALLPDYKGADVIIAHGDSLLLPIRGIATLRVMHGSAFDEARTARSPFRKVLQFGVYLQEIVTSWTQPTIAISRNTRARYRAVRDVIPNGVDTSRFRADISQRTPAPSILFVGTLQGRKRGNLLLDWFCSVIQPTLPDASLWMVTEPGPALPGVCYFPGISEDELQRLYRSAWVMASPSVYEGFGLPYLEAMASGTPVIATANPGSEEVLDGGRYGLLVRDDDAFASTLLSLIGNDGLRERCSELGLGRARELSLTRMIDRYESALEALVHRAIPEEARA